MHLLWSETDYDRDTRSAERAKSATTATRGAGSERNQLRPRQAERGASEIKKMPTRRLPAIGRVLGYWRAERRTIRHGLVSLAVSTVGEIAAGVALGAMTGTL